MTVISFDEALANSAQYSKRHLLLGNGFSIACIPTIFTYASLYSSADFTEMPEVQQIFQMLKTEDFELVVNILEQASTVLQAYGLKEKVPAQMKLHAQKLKEALIQTLAANHPDHTGAIEPLKYSACQRFLANFLDHGNSCIYTLNYDLLLYWTLMQARETKSIQALPNDGFGKDFDEVSYTASEYVTWQGEGVAHGQNIHYLHGALHLYDRGADIEKFTWSGTGIKLIEQARTALASNRFPLFVSEGDSLKKMVKITHSAYLYHSYKCFSAEMKAGKSTAPKCLFTYGVSLGENDTHILKKISAGKVAYLFVSLYGAPGTQQNKQIIQAAENVKRRRREGELAITYYDAASAKVWG